MKPWVGILLSLLGLVIVIILITMVAMMGANGGFLDGFSEF